MESLDLVWFSFLQRSHPSDKASGALGSYVQAQGCTAGEQLSQEPVHSLLGGSTCEHTGSVVGKASADWRAGRASIVLSKPVSPSLMQPRPSLPGYCNNPKHRRPLRARARCPLSPWESRWLLRMTGCVLLLPGQLHPGVTSKHCPG